MTDKNVAKRSRIAITGGTGFVGSALADLLRERGCEVVLIARRPRGPLPAGTHLHAIGLGNPAKLTEALVGCDAVAHLAGINREIGNQTYEAVQIQGTANLIAAARSAGVRRMAMLSFLRARPDCGSAYHESKWLAGEMIRQSGLDYTIVKSGVIYGRGDHLLDHISHAIHTLPLFATVGLHQPPLRPVAVRDVANILAKAVTSDRLVNQTVAVVGPEELTMRQVVQRIAAAADRHACVFPMPVRFHRCLARATEATMRVPLIAQAQVRILEEGLCDPVGPCSPLPADLVPRTRMTQETIRHGLPEPGPFRFSDLRCGN